MNLGIIVLGLLLVSASAMAVFMIAGANAGQITDSFGYLPSNATQEIISNTTAPLMGAAGGMVLIIAALLLFGVAAVLVVAIQRR